MIDAPHIKDQTWPFGNFACTLTKFRDDMLHVYIHVLWLATIKYRNCCSSSRVRPEPSTGPCWVLHWILWLAKAYMDQRMPLRHSFGNSGVTWRDTRDTREAAKKLDEHGSWWIMDKVGHTTNMDHGWSWIMATFADDCAGQGLRATRSPPLRPRSCVLQSHHCAAEHHAVGQQLLVLHLLLEIRRFPMSVGVG